MGPGTRQMNRRRLVQDAQLTQRPRSSGKQKLPSAPGESIPATLFEGWRLKMQHGLPYVAVLILLSSVPLCAQDLTQGGPPAPAAAADASANHDVGSDSDDSGW